MFKKCHHSHWTFDWKQIVFRWTVNSIIHFWTCLVEVNAKFICWSHVHIQIQNRVVQRIHFTVQRRRAVNYTCQSSSMPPGVQCQSHVAFEFGLQFKLHAEITLKTLDIVAVAMQYDGTEHVQIRLLDLSKTCRLHNNSTYQNIHKLSFKWGFRLQSLTVITVFIFKSSPGTSIENIKTWLTLLETHSSGFTIYLQESSQKQWEDENPD